MISDYKIGRKFKNKQAQLKRHENPFNFINNIIIGLLFFALFNIMDFFYLVLSSIYCVKFLI
jgi:hypothetical protein